METASKELDLTTLLSEEHLRDALKTGRFKHAFNVNDLLDKALKQLMPHYNNDLSNVIRNGIVELYRKKYLFDSLSNEIALTYSLNILNSPETCTVLNTHIYKKNSNFTYKSDVMKAIGKGVAHLINNGGVFVEIVSPTICDTYSHIWETALDYADKDALHRYSIYPLREYGPFGNFIAWQLRSGKYAVMDGWGYFNPEGKKVAQLITSSDYASIFYERHKEIRENRRFCEESITVQEALKRYS
jgi:hypothetical protein